MGRVFFLDTENQNYPILDGTVYFWSALVEKESNFYKEFCSFPQRFLHLKLKTSETGKNSPSLLVFSRKNWNFVYTSIYIYQICEKAHACNFELMALSGSK